MHMLGDQGYTQFRMDYTKKKSKQVVKQIFTFTLLERQFIRVIDTIKRQILAETKTEKNLDLMRHKIWSDQ